MHVHLSCLSDYFGSQKYDVQKNVGNKLKGWVFREILGKRELQLAKNQVKNFRQLVNQNVHSKN